MSKQNCTPYLHQLKEHETAMMGPTNQVMMRIPERRSKEHMLVVTTQ